MKFVLDSDDGLSSAMSTDILAAHNLVPEGRGDAPSQGLPIRLIHGRQYLEVDQNSFPVFDNGHSTPVRRRVFSSRTADVRLDTVR
jgi:hypothetical protein